MIEKFRCLSEFLTVHGKPIEIIATLLTLFFIAYQTVQMNLNINEIKKSVVLDSHQAVHDHRQRINQILLENDPELAKSVFGIDKPKLVGYTLSTDYESLFHMRCSGLLPDSMWHDIETMMYNTLTKVPFVKEFWKNNHPAVSAKFASYIAELTNSGEVNYGQVDKHCEK